MAQSDARFGYQAKLSREEHNLSSPVGFTCCPGMLLPIFADVCSAGDYLEVTHDLPFLRTSPLAAPAMVDVKIHFESFFVPFQMIYQPMENSMYYLDNIQSAMYIESMLQGDKLPLFDYKSFSERYSDADASEDFRTSQVRQDAFRLADMLRLGAPNFLYAWPLTSWQHYTPSFFPWQLLSYHTIFMYYYRLDDKTQFNNAQCNWDNKYLETAPIEGDGNLFQLHSRPWDFDYYTSMYRSPIISSVNTQTVLGASHYTDLLSPTDYSSQTASLTDVGSFSFNNDRTRAFGGVSPSSYDQTAQQLAVNTVMIRQMFANEKLAMITGRTKKNYDSQVLAHLGIKVPTDVKHDLQLIGHDTYELRIGEVTSLASTDDSPLGELAGKGWASSRDGNEPKVHKFRAPVDGVVMTIFSIEPVRRYYGGFARHNAVTTALNFPKPEFDRLGNVPMFGYEVGDASVQPSNIIGWKERYFEWKRRSPFASFAFANLDDIANGKVNPYESYMLVTKPFQNRRKYWIGYNGAITQSTDVYSHPDTSDTFYIPFNAMDDLVLTPYCYGFACEADVTQPVFNEDWDTAPSQIYARDPFIVDAYPRITKVSWMSKDGEPIYPW